MKIDIKQLLRGILISSIAMISNAHGDIDIRGQLPNLNSPVVSSSEERKKGRSQSNFILRASNSFMLFAKSHRSHSSHRSHTSHRSSSSSGGSRSYYTPTSPIRTNQNSTNAQSTSVKVFNLGDREIHDGMSGKDVTQLIELLVYHKYLPKRIPTNKYTSAIRDAVMSFQIDAELTPTGTCDRVTIKTLQNWEDIKAQKDEQEWIKNHQDELQETTKSTSHKGPNKTFKLGERLLSIGCVGQDVDSLIKLLKNLKFLTADSDFDSYNSSVSEAVKKAQIQLKLEPSGEADYNTINALQNLKKGE